MEKGFLYSVVHEKCPRCNEGDLFVNGFWSMKDIAKVPDKCPVCNQDFRIEDGFFLGATYVSYAFTIILAFITMAVMWLGFHINFTLMIFTILFELVVLMIPIVRYSRSIWFNIFVHYDPEWMKLAGLNKQSEV